MARGGPRPLEQRIESALAALLPEYPRVRLCIALSGGLDSTVLLTALALCLRRGGAGRQRRAAAQAGIGSTPRARGGPALRAVHVDHGLHPDSAAWAAHCRALADRLHIPLIVVPVAVERARGASLEAAAREARYGALAAQLDAGEVLLTAQHADDQLETVLLQLLRGAGMRGLAAMPPIAHFSRGLLARPLLDCERSEIEAWARGHGLEWIEDATNADERLDRNYLRRRIVPLLRARWPAAGRALSRSARHIAEGQRLLDLLARADVERAAVGDSLSVRRLRALTPDRRRNALRYWIAGLGGPLPDSRRLAELCGPLIEARADAHPEVAWAGRSARREGDRLTLVDRGGSRALEALPPLSIEWTPHVPAAHVPFPSETARRERAAAVLDLPAGLGRLELAPDPHGPIDLDALPAQLSVRLRRGGERLRLRRGGPSRALKALLQEARIPRDERARIPLVWAGERLLAAGDLWVDAVIRAGAQAGRRARLVWHRDPHIC